MKFKPTKDNILVKVDRKPDTTPGGLALPANSSDRPSQGEVIAVGDGLFDDNGGRKKMEVKVGDRVVFSTYGGSDINLHNVDYKLFPEDQILMIEKK